MDKALEIKRKHHYVWAFYLRQWAPNDEGVWYRTSKNNIAQDNPDGLSQQPDFYKLGHLRDEDIEYIRKWPVPPNESLIAFQESQLKWFAKISRLVFATEEFKGAPEYKELKTIARAMEANIFENTHTAIESLAAPVMKELISGNQDCLQNPKFMTSFCNYLGHQLFRTRKIRDLTLQSILAHSGQNELWKAYAELYRRNSWYLSYRNGINMGHSLLSSAGTDKHVYIRNNTPVDFITTDHPVINIHSSAKNSSLTKSPSSLDLYYPISPRYAYIISESTNYNHLSRNITTEEVINLNRLIAEKAHRNIYATSKAGLKGLIINTKSL